MKSEIGKNRDEWVINSIVEERKMHCKEEGEKQVRERGSEGVRGEVVIFPASLSM